MTLEEMIMALPHLTHDEGKKNLIVTKEEDYISTLYYFDNEWVVDWLQFETGDSAISFIGKTPTEAITKAYNWCKKHNLIK